MVEKAFSLSHALASKMLAVIYASIFETSATAVWSIAFTVDEAKVWQIREAVNGSLGDAYRRGLTPIFIAADKAYASASNWDLRGWPRTVYAALREVDFFVTLIGQRSSGFVTVKVNNWPRRADLESEAEKVMGFAAAVAAGHGRKPWIDDVYERQTMERWRDFLLSAGVASIEVWLPGTDRLQAEGYLTSNKVIAPIGDILQGACRELALAAGVITAAEHAEKTLKAGDVLVRLRAAGMLTGEVFLKELHLSKLRKRPELRGAVHRHLDKFYLEQGRDFSQAFSFPESIEVAPGAFVLVSTILDKVHGINNLRMASANAKEGAVPEAIACHPAEVHDQADGAGEGELFGEDLVAEDVDT